MNSVGVCILLIYTFKERTTWFPTSPLYRKFKIKKDAVEWVLVLLCVRKVPASNSVPEIPILTDFLYPLWVNAGRVTPRAASFHVFPIHNSLIIPPKKSFRSASLAELACTCDMSGTVWNV
jgi:hypothetical protein